MSYIEPNTSLKILRGIPFDPDYQNTRYFHSLGEQELYFIGHAVKSIDYMTYQRRERGVIRVGWVATTPASVIAELYDANYMMFKNTNFENKWFYAFILNVEYVNNNTVDITYKIDVIQSWFFETNFNQCLIERTHTITDNLGEHTVPEKLEHGPYFEELADYEFNNASVSDGIYHYQPAICLVTSFDSQGDYASGALIQGQTDMGDFFSGLHYSIWSLADSLTIPRINTTLRNIAEGTQQTGSLVDGVIALFMIPFNFANAFTGNPVNPESLYFDIRTTVNNVLGYHLGTYRPRNKKLMCYPYNLLYVSNNQGQNAEFRWENFANAIHAQLDIWGNVSPDSALSCCPVGYNGVNGRNPEQRLELTGFPMVSWSYDAYKAWYAQNKGYLGSRAFGLSVGLASAVGKGFIGGDISGAIEGVENTLVKTANLLGEVYDHSRMPPQAQGNANVSLQYQQGLMTYSFYRKHIKEEYAKIIDAYFDMYGYAVNQVGTPVRMTRDCYTYIKTVGCVIDGDIPADTVAEIEKIHDRGIRYWVVADNKFGNYSPSVNPNEVTIGG